MHVGLIKFSELEVPFMHMINGYTVVTAWFLEVVIGLTTSPFIEPDPSVEADNFEVGVIEPQLIELRKCVQISRLIMVLTT